MSSTAPKNVFVTALAGDLSSLLSSGKYSDLTIRCEETTWKVHKMMMCTQSKFFAKACDGEFVEAKTDEIELAGDDPLVVEAMIRSIYEGDYAGIEERDGFLQNPLLFHAKVYAIGEKYGMDPLKDMARTKTEFILNMEWSPTYFFDAVDEVYESTIAEDRGLRDIYVLVATVQGSKMFENKEFEETMDRSCQFWKDYSKKLQEKYNQEKYKQVKCKNPSCSNEFSSSHLYYGHSIPAYCPRCCATNYFP